MEKIKTPEITDPRDIMRISEMIADYQKNQSEERRRARQWLTSRIQLAQEWKSKKRTDEYRIVVQKKGRLSKIAWNLITTCMTEAGILLPDDIGSERENSRALVYAPRELPNLKIISVRSSDIPGYISNKNADLGITGEDCVVENDFSNVEILGKLGEGGSSLAMAIPENSSIRSIESLRGKTVVTSLPNTVRKYLEGKNVRPVKIKTVDGCAEAAKALGLSEAIFDLVESGKTLEANGYRQVETIRSFEAVLIGKYYEN